MSVDVLPAGVREVKVFRRGAAQPQNDHVAEEVPVALVYNGISHVVMMATPRDLKEFALGFSLAEGIITSPAEIYDIDIHPACDGLAVELTIASERFWKLKTRRRFLAGRTGCGLCGIEKLQDVAIHLPPLGTDAYFDLAQLSRALKALKEIQEIGALTGCTHAAAWVSPHGDLVGGAEDVARHVALDKLLGMRALKGWKEGALLVSSRASYEMVQKAAMCGVQILFAVSAPTARAIDAAHSCGLTLAAFCRGDSVNVYTSPERLKVGASA